MKPILSIVVMFITLSYSTYGQELAVSYVEDTSVAREVLFDTDKLYFSQKKSIKEPIKFNRVGYKEKNDELTFTTDKIVEYIEVYKNDEPYLKKIPVFTNNLYINLKNFDRGLYQLKLYTDVMEEPVVTQVIKRTKK